MDSQKISKLLLELRIVASLKSGLTLSTTNMTVVDHKTWSTTFWRTYAGENRKTTIHYIKAILADALYNFQENSYPFLLVEIHSALLGFSTLKETYVLDEYTVQDIETTISYVEKELDITIKKQEETIVNLEIEQKITARLVKHKRKVQKARMQTYTINHQIQNIGKSIMEPSQKTPKLELKDIHEYPPLTR